MIQLFEKRRAELIDLLKTRKELIDLSRQHQIYGAIKEIELFLETLGYYQESMLREQTDMVSVLEKVDKRPLLNRVKDALRDNII
jgi:uncharacterized protein YaaR (DUF327 family)